MKTNDANFDPADFAAVGTWATVVAISFYFLTKLPTEIQSQWPWISLLFIAYIGCYWAIHKRPKTLKANHEKAYLFTALSIQLLCVFVLISLLPFNYLSILTIIWAGIVAYFLPIRSTLILVFLVVIAFFSFFAWQWEQSNVFVHGALFLTFHYFAVLTSHQTNRAEVAKLELERVNQELQATQQLLSEVSRQNERTRIARDLHDLLGHHLTALIINLQVADHLADGEVKDKITQCHSLAKLLLSDVREAVSTMRENQNLDLEKMIELMAENLPKLDIKTNIDTTLKLDDLDLVKALLSIIQESITNTLKHSRAKNFWINLTQQEEQLVLVLHDDGLIKHPIKEGNGITGMRERTAALNGKLNLEIVENALRLTVTIPRKDSAHG